MEVPVTVNFVSVVLYFPAVCLWIGILLSVLRARKSPQNLKSIIINTARTALCLLTIVAPFTLYKFIHEPCNSSEYEFWAVLMLFALLVIGTITLYIVYFRKSVLISTLTFISDFLLTIFLVTLYAFFYENISVFFANITPFILTILFTKKHENYRNRVSLKTVFIICLCLCAFYFMSIFYDKIEQNKKYNVELKEVNFNLDQK